MFNTRRAIFADIRVREAIALLFDSTGSTRISSSAFIGATPVTSTSSELSAVGRPADATERRLLSAFPGAVRDDVLEGKWAPPSTDGSGRDRDTLKKALALLSEAGFDLVGTELRDRKTGAPFTFEILVTTREQERLALAFARDLKRAGITASLRNVDAVQFDRRKLTYDYDMIEYRWDQSLSPGNEQAFYWGSAAADIDGTRNYMGVRSPAIDAAIAALLQARERPRICFRCAHARPNPDIWVLRRAALSSAGTMGRSLVSYRTSRGDFAVRLSARNLVARAMRPSMILGEISRGASADAGDHARRYPAPRTRRATRTPSR